MASFSFLHVIRYKRVFLAESWGDISYIEEKIRKIETKALRRILKIKKTTTTDLVYFELNRPSIISKIKDSQFKFFNKVMNIGHDEAIVRYIIDLCCNEDVIQ